ncbi:MAG: hypothetical protein AB8G05_18220 [Oligoflexales bacterium]
MSKVLVSSLFTLFFTSNLFAAEVVLCTKPKSLRSLKCIFKIEAEENIQRRDKVLVFNDKRLLVASGIINGVFSKHFIALFEDKATVKRLNKAKVIGFGDEKKNISYESLFE